MVQFITQYWIEFLFGLIVAGLGVFCKTVWSLYKKEKQRRLSDRDQELTKKIEAVMATDKKEIQQSELQLQNQINQTNIAVSNLTIGVLSVQGKAYREQCYHLLETGHKITCEEFEQEEEDYHAYKGLGGNHRGDALHSAVKEKFETQVSN